MVKASFQFYSVQIPSFTKMPLQEKQKTFFFLCLKACLLRYAGKLLSNHFLIYLKMWIELA